MEIRETNLEDYESIKNLLESENMIGKWFTKEKLSKMLKKDKKSYFVAEIEDKTRGSIFSNDDGGYYGYISKLIVDKNHRNNGVAHRLIKAVMDNFKARNIEWVFAHVKKDNIPSINLFKKFGIKIRETHYLIDNG
ncbi:MAG: GNAT family N-acetyltransferase [Nanoarchaeota archaeon]